MRTTSDIEKQFMSNKIMPWDQNVTVKGQCFRILLMAEAAKRYQVCAKLQDLLRISDMF